MNPFVAKPEFLAFLHAAKIATYASQGDEASVAPLLPDSKQLEYSQGPYAYRDIYVGMLRFVGQEVVYFNGRAVWSMSYSGGLLPGVHKVDAPQIYRTLRAALSAVPAVLPLRGPESFEREDFSYACSTEGSIEHFHGREVVSRGSQLVYELRFSGGGLA